MIRYFYLPFRCLLLALTFLVGSSVLFGQETDVKISSEPSPGVNFNQHWPGVFERNGKVFVVWGEPRVDTITNAAPIWYSTGIWSKRTSPSVDVIAAFRPDSLLADDGTPSKPLYQNVLGNAFTAVFDGLWVVGSAQLRGDINLPPARTDTVYKARFMLYFAAGTRWVGAKVHELKRTGVGVAVLMRQFGYNPASGEVLAAWIATTDQTGNVSSVDTSGTVKWTATNVPFPAGRYNLVPLKDKEFLLIVDSTAIRYDNGLPIDTLNFPVRDGLRYQRISGDRFIRSYVSSDTTQYILEVYDLNGSLTKTVQLPWGWAPTSYFITENRHTAIEDDASFAVISAGLNGVHAQFLRDDFSPLKPLEKLSTGADSTAYAPAGTFQSDTLFAVWQDSRNDTSDVYGRAFNYRPHVIVDTAVDVIDIAQRQIDAGSIAPNPASQRVTLDIVLPYSTAVNIEIVDLAGRVVRQEPERIMQEGHRSIDIDVRDLASGNYRMVIRAGQLNAVGKLVIVR
jgi:hypothetical protein